MSELYISDMTTRESRPRSKRLRGLGFRSRSFSGTQQEIVSDGLFEDLFEKVTVGTDNDGNPIFAIHAKYALFSDYDITAGGPPDSIGQQSSGALYLLADIAKSADGEHVGQTSGGIAAAAGQVLGFDGTHWHAVDMQGGGSSVSWGAESNHKIPLTVQGVSKTLLMDGSLSDYMLKTGVSWGAVSGNTIPLTVQGVTKTLLMDGALSAYLQKSGGQMTGNLHMYGNMITLCTYTSAEDCVLYADNPENVYLKAYRNLYLSASTGNVYIDGSRAATVTDLSGYALLNGSETQNFSAKSLNVPSTNINGHVKIGDAYLWYNPTAHALMVTAASGSNVKISIVSTGDNTAGETVA